MAKYTWKASSDDGSYEVVSPATFDTKESAYEDMRAAALEKMKWNTDFYDVEEDNTIGYTAHFSRNKIVHESYSGIYTYEIVPINEKVYLHDRDWEVIESFTPRAMRDWNVCIIEGVGSMWMNNIEGYIVLIEKDRILKSDI